MGTRLLFKSLPNLGPGPTVSDVKTGLAHPRFPTCGNACVVDTQMGVCVCEKKGSQVAEGSLGRGICLPHITWVRRSIGDPLVDVIIGDVRSNHFGDGSELKLISTLPAEFGNTRSTSGPRPKVSQGKTPW